MDEEEERQAVGLAEPAEAEESSSSSDEGEEYTGRSITVGLSRVAATVDDKKVVSSGFSINTLYFFLCFFSSCPREALLDLGLCTPSFTPLTPLPFFQRPFIR